MLLSGVCVVAFGEGIYGCLGMWMSVDSMRRFWHAVNENLPHFPLANSLDVRVPGCSPPNTIDIIVFGP